MYILTTMITLAASVRYFLLRTTGRGFSLEIRRWVAMIQLYNRCRWSPPCGTLLIPPVSALSLYHFDLTISSLVEGSHLCRCSCHRLGKGTATGNPPTDKVTCRRCGRRLGCTHCHSCQRPACQVRQSCHDSEQSNAAAMQARQCARRCAVHSTAGWVFRSKRMLESSVGVARLRRWRRLPRPSTAAMLFNDDVLFARSWTGVGSTEGATLERTVATRARWRGRD